MNIQSKYVTAGCNGSTATSWFSSESQLPVFSALQLAVVYSVYFYTFIIAQILKKSIDFLTFSPFFHHYFRHKAHAPQKN
jgi:hypothetical protein